MDKNISFTLKVWRQAGPKAKGAFETYQMKDIPGDTSFLEMLDILNEQLISERKEPVVFDHDCRDTTAAKVSAVCVLFTSTDIRTVLQQVLLPARFICVASTTVTPLPLNLGVRPVSLLSRT